MSLDPRILVAPGGSMKKTLRAALAVDGPPFLLTYAAYLEVRAECGGTDEAAWRWLFQRAKYGTRPLLVNIENLDGSSNTVALASHGWSPEKLRDYVGGLGEALEQELGEVSRIWNLSLDRITGTAAGSQQAAVFEGSRALHTPRMAQ